MSTPANTRTDLEIPTVGLEYSPFPASPAGDPIWYDSANLCALADNERHLGHAVHTGITWIAYDATHLNADADGFLVLGNFESLVAAKFAIEAAIGRSGNWMSGRNGHTSIS